MSKIIGKNYQKVAFLGCPVLGIEFSKLCPGKSILLDIDKKIIKIISERYKVDIAKVNSNCIEPIKILKEMVNI